MTAHCPIQQNLKNILNVKFLQNVQEISTSMSGMPNMEECADEHLGPSLFNSLNEMYDYESAGFEDDTGDIYWEFIMDLDEWSGKCHMSEIMEYLN